MILCAKSASEVARQSRGEHGWKTDVYKRQLMFPSTECHFEIF